MPNSIITAAGLALFADALYSGETITIDRLVFADVPGLDPAVTPDENQSLPPAGQIMLDAEISHSGKVDENTVVYSTILTANDGNFYINWIGLYSTEHETLVAVCVVPRHYKFKTDGFQAGNTLYKNFAIQYANAAALTGISINPETWQYNFDTRYALKDHNHDTRYEPLGAVNEHNNATDPHPGKFESAGAVKEHNNAADPHPGKFAAANHSHNLSGKANITFDNLNLDTALANLGMYGSHQGIGFQRLPGGLFIQWGVIVYSGQYTYVTFPVAFPNGVMAVTFGASADAAPTDRIIVPGSLSNSGFTYNSSPHSGTYYIAIGH